MEFYRKLFDIPQFTQTSYTYDTDRMIHPRVK